MAIEFTKADLETARAEGEKAGATAEWNRIAGIIRSGEAKGLQAVAVELALGELSLSVDTASAMLSRIAIAAGPSGEAAPALHGADRGGAFWRDGPARIQ